MSNKSQPYLGMVGIRDGFWGFTGFAARFANLAAHVIQKAKEIQ